MKKLYTLLSFILITTTLFAQAPEMMSYQAIVRDASDALIQNGNIGVRISILQGSETGAAVYTETHNTNTNNNGLVTLNIGAGTTSDDFSTINWNTGTYYVKSETDPSGGSNYTISGTSQLLSVPYALYAKTSNVENLPSSSIIGSIETDNGALGLMTSNSAYAFNSNFTSNQWWSKALDGTPQQIIGSEGNIGVLTSSNAYAFNSNQSGNQWWSKALDGTPLEFVASGGNIGVMTSSTAYAFNSNYTSNQWWSKTLDGAPIKIVTSNGTMGVLTSTTAYAFNPNASGNQWWSKALNGIPQRIIAKNGHILVYTSTNVYAFNSNQIGNQWWSTTINGTPISIAE